VSKLTDCDGESSETDSALDFAIVTTSQRNAMLNWLPYPADCKLLDSMIKNPGSSLIR
jgi:hypothetical protein